MKEFLLLICPWDVILQEGEQVHVEGLSLLCLIQCSRVSCSPPASDPCRGEEGPFPREQARPRQALPGDQQHQWQQGLGPDLAEGTDRGSAAERGHQGEHEQVAGGCWRYCEHCGQPLPALAPGPDSPESPPCPGWNSRPWSPGCSLPGCAQPKPTSALPSAVRFRCPD